MKVFLTGTTGFLGGELAVLLSKRPEVERLYCLVRPEGDAHAPARLKAVFDFHSDPFDPARIIPVEGNLRDGDLEARLSADRELRDVDVIIHAAADTSFAPANGLNLERVNIGGTAALARWARSLAHLETFCYVGTASICGARLTNCNVHEDQSPYAGAEHLVKYCYTKMVGEMDVRKTIPAEKLLIVRPSIIMGDSRNWAPRSTVILWALAAVNLMRLIPADPSSNLDIIPVDYAARALVELLFAQRRWTTYHISAGRSSATTLEAITSAAEDPALNRPQFRFVGGELLEQMKKWPKKLAASSELHHYAPYLDYWRRIFGGNGRLRLLLAGMEPYFEFMGLNQTFDNARLLSDTAVGPPPPAHDYLPGTRQFLHQIDVGQGALDP
jgi:thioester reductase-like protein